MLKDSLGDRMKRYEDVNRTYLQRRIPVIIRVDGKSFSNFVRNNFGSKGYFEDFARTMALAASATAQEMQGCSLVYVQSDEVSFLLTDYKTIQTQAWFDYNVNKLVSTSAALMTAWFNYYLTVDTIFPATFDSRAFNIPQDDVCNYFIFRQQDATRNAIQMAGQEYYSPKQLNKKTCSDIQEMLFKNQGINFDKYSSARKRGMCIVDGQVDNDIPIFTKDRNYIEKFVFVRED